MISSSASARFFCCPCSQMVSFMEPLWVGLAVPKVVAAANAVSRTVAEPFSDVLEKAQSILRKEPQPQPSILSSAKNPHTQLLSELLTGQSLTSGAGSIDIADIRTHADDLQDSLQRRIRELFDLQGIELEEPVQLRVSPFDGQLEIASDSSQRAMVEAALASDSTIAADFRQLAAMRSITAAAEKHSEFADAYALNPYQAVTKFAALFEEPRQAVLQIRGAEAELRFESR